MIWTEELSDEDSGGRIIYTIKDNPITTRKNNSTNEPLKILNGSNGEKMKITKVIIIAAKNAMLIPRNNLVNIISLSIRG